MEAVVFDLDGVIVDTEQYWYAAEKEIFREVTGEEIDPSSMSGMTISNTYRQLDDEYGLNIDFQEFLDMYEQRAKEIYMEKAELMPGFKTLLEELRSKGLAVAVSSGSYWTRYVVERFELEFDAISDSNVVEGDGKPDPETYELALEMLDVNPQEAVAVDDTDPGIESADRAGLHCIGYGSSEGQRLSRADETVEGPQELSERLLELAD